MKKQFILSIAFALAAASAFATNNSSNQPSTGNSSVSASSAAGGNGYGGDGGTGVGLGVGISGSASSSDSHASAIQGQVANGGNSTIKDSGNSSSDSVAGVVGSGNSKNDNKSSASGNKTSTNVSVGGDTVERNAPGVFAAAIPSVARSCRLYMFGGATNTSGAVSGSIPLGNDQTCLSGAKIDYMTAANRLYPGAFSKESVVAAVCAVEGMEAAAECKK